MTHVAFISGSILVAMLCGQLRQVDDKNLGPGPYYDRWQRLKQTEKLRESLEDSFRRRLGPGSPTEIDLQ